VIYILLIVLGLFVVAFFSSRPAAEVLPRKRIMLVSLLLAACLFSRAYYDSTRPPFINYWSTGWTYLIRHLNQQYQSVGNPNRIQMPGE
jgi:hypothetical protein